MSLVLKNLSYTQKVVSSMIEEILIETEVYGDTIETESDSLIGTPGIDGATFIPSVSEDGVISWTNDKDLENPTPVNIKGEQGEQGAMGPQGPVGPQGEQGPKGEKGDQGIQGIQGIQGEPGADYVLTEADKKEIAGMIEVSGEVDDLSNYYTKTEVDDKIEQIELTPGPKGEQGIQGEPGAQGPKGDKGEKGEDAYIKITDNIRKLDITTLDTGLYLFLGNSEYAAADLYYGEIYSGLILNRGTYLMIRNSDPYYTGYVFEPTNNIFLFSISSTMTEFKIEEYATKEELPTQISQLENDSGYVTNTDYASNDNVGLIKTELYYGLHTSSRNGSLYCEQVSYDEYTNDKDDNCFVGKGTLENVLEAKDYASKGYVDEQISNIEVIGGSSLDVYSTEEQVIGTYLDKPLYKKTYTGIIQNEYAGTYYTIIKLENEEKFERVIDYKGFFSDTTNEVGNLFDIRVDGVAPIKISNGNVDLRTPQMFYKKYFEVTLYYTKTTI